MPAMRCIEAGQSDEPVCACLGTKISVGIASCNFDRSALDTSFFTFIVLVDLGLEVMFFCPTSVHTQEHLCPVLSIDAPTACMNTHDSSARVMFSAQHQRKFKLLDLFLKFGHGLSDFYLHAFIWLALQQFG